MEKVLAIQNIKCGGCANTITKGLLDIDGISHVKVDHENGVVAFEFTDDAQLSVVEQKLDKMGYPVDPDQNTMLKKAKSYVSCMIGRFSDKEEEEKA